MAQANESSMIKAADVLHQLRKVKRSGKGWTSCCPAHEDKRPSFSIADGERGLMMHCFAGCSIERIKAALGLTYSVSVPRVAVSPKPEHVSLPNPLALWKGWERETDPYHLDGFAMSLGVDTDALRAIGCVWARNAWAFPMRDENKNVIGIRLRNDKGEKWAIKGSRQGLFIPTDHPHCVDNGTLYIVEGPTDLAAAMSLGLYAIGRPSCLGQELMITNYVRQRKVYRVVIVSDNDTAGLNGARKLQDVLKQRSCIYLPPTKDIREYAIRGGTANLIESSIRDLVWKAAYTCQNNQITSY